MLKPFRLFCSFLLLLFGLNLPVQGQVTVPTPEESTGFPLGADYKLARWEQITTYFRALAAASDRVHVESQGQTTEGLDFILAFISSPQNLDNLAHHQRIQRQLADPRGRDPEDLAQLARDGKAVVLINCGLHSNEVASSQMSMELAYQLATRDTPQVNEILDNVILLLIPSTNPDGLNMIVDWYGRTVGTPYEASPMPWLYHTYTGHDNNRDWFMLTQVETQIATRILYEEWFPQVVYDIHQMDNSGGRFVIPPYFDPVNPNIPPLLLRELSLIGAQLALDMTSQGLTGVLSNAVYDTWWHGGFRTVPYRHNMIGILTEAASVNIASPIFQPIIELKGHRRGLVGYAQQTNFPEPWPGGWWRLRDIIDYEEAACYSILSTVTRQREMFLTNFYRLGLRAVERGKSEPPRAFLVPQKQRDLNSALKMLDILRRGGVEVHQAAADFVADGVQRPRGTYVILMAQPFGAHAKDLLEIQTYPERRAAPGGVLERPYDIAGWTLPLQMGVHTITVINPFEADLMLLEEIPRSEGKLHTNPESVGYLLKNQTNAETIALNRLLKQSGYKLQWASTEFSVKGATFPRGSVWIVPPPNAMSDLQELAESLGIELYTSDFPPIRDAELKQPRLGLYKPWVASIDEGWTRWVLEQHEFVYQSVTDAEIRAGNLYDSYDVIILPDMKASAIIEGHREGTLPPEYVGGIGALGVANLRSFVDAGGTLICLNEACEVAVANFGLEIIEDALKAKNRSQPESPPFYCPGSLLRVFVDTTHPIGYGMNREIAVFFKSGPAFEVRGGKSVASYPAFNPLMSGWLEGEARIQRAVALWDMNLGQGHVILFGFKPQHRAQSHGTFKLLFNAIYYGVSQ